MARIFDNIDQDLLSASSRDTASIQAVNPEADRELFAATANAFGNVQSDYVLHTRPSFLESMNERL